MLIELNEGEIRLAVQAGADRRIGAILNSSREVYGKMSRGDYWGGDIEAVAAEISVAKALGMYWGPAASAAEDRAAGDLPGGIQVRHTQYKTGRLLLHDRDDDDHRFVLVVGQIPVFTVVGWIQGGDGKRQVHWDDKLPRPTFAVGQEHLHPISSL